MQWIALIVALLATSACDDVRELLDSKEIEQQLREDPGRPGKVGSLAAVAIYQRAARVAKAADTAPDRRCELDVGPGERWESTLQIERRRGSELVARWSETRRLRVTGQGLETELSAKYQTPIGMAGQRHVAWRKIDDDVWLTAEGADGPLWYRRDATSDEEARILGASLGSFQALVDAVDGWRRAGDGWSVGDEPLRCVQISEGLAFIDRFVARAKVERASLEATETTRRLRARWILQDQSIVTIDYRDRVEPESGKLAPPPSDRVVPVERDRSLARARKLADDLAARGLVELTKISSAESEAPAKGAK